MDRLGITRVTDITRLDRIGIPVYASIRPGARKGSLCVNAGKGFTPEEARAGAMMEAIEFAMAEYGAADIPLVRATARDVLDGHSRPEAILDFCPALETAIPLDSPLPCVEAEDVATGEHVLVPAELIFLPTPRDRIPDRYFGANSNGLCSGNTVAEATVHGLAELIERDISSFYSLVDRSALVDPRSYPEQAAALADLLCQTGFRLFVRHQPNDFGIPWFVATLVDVDHPSPYYVNGGCGCHPDASIALVRAICEAAQSRLAFIHGGRDDLARRYDRFSDMDETACADFVARLVASARRSEGSITFQDVPDLAAEAPDVSSALGCLLARLRAAGIRRVLRVCYTRPEDDLHVLRVLAPGLEHFSDTSHRLGPRLRAFLQASGRAD
jgi:ribosomal protein S12 methylthiotransferase accessory factor